MSATRTFIITVESAPPTAGIAGPNNGAPGQPRDLALRARDVAADQAAGFTYAIDWGDNGPVQFVAPTAGNGAVTGVNHIYPTAGIYSVRVTATDQDGASSAPVTHTIQVKEAGLQADPLKPSKTALVVGGTPGNDQIVLKASAASGRVRAFLNGVNLGAFLPTARVIAFGQGGDDVIQVIGSLKLPAELYGGDGNDQLTGSKGNDLLAGGDGDDTLVGLTKHDLLLGGLGADHMEGQGGNDLVIGDGTAYDASPTWLRDLWIEWTAARDFDVRVANLRDASRPRYLALGDTVLDDGVVDSLFALPGTDWIFDG
jgi:Ca2+-binding RTX toxin-like protein